MGATSSKNAQDTHEIHLPNATQEQYQNKAILLTGASRGLGWSLAHALASCHPSLLILSGRDKEALESVKAECLQIATHTQTTQDAPQYDERIRVECLQCDLSDKSSVENLATSSLQLAKSSPLATIDILINNGGISSRSSFLETRLEVDERLMQVNFLSGAGWPRLWFRVWWRSAGVGLFGLVQFRARLEHPIAPVTQPPNSPFRVIAKPCGRNWPRQMYRFMWLVQGIFGLI
eukprot:CCRYP_014860-RA/>CCRYP_014860-RA protein AED:0.13 eAED:0.13 QI:186/1/1/1/0.5/0.66/3/617/233